VRKGPNPIRFENNTEHKHRGFKQFFYIRALNFLDKTKNDDENY